MAEDLTGKVFGRLTVIERVDDYVSPKGERKPRWRCRCCCDKQNEVLVTANNLKKGNTTSCGCVRNEILYDVNSKRMKVYNDYEVQEDYVIMYTQKGEPFYVDLDDFWRIKDICWHIADGYVKGKIKDDESGKFIDIALSRYIMNCPPNMEVDHIHGSNTLNDNRKSNLRIVTRSQNCMNRDIFSNNKSGATGVYWNKKSKKWNSEIDVDGKYIWIGSFNNKEDAINARKKAEEKYFGDFSCSRRNV